MDEQRKARDDDVCGLCACYPNGLVSLLAAQILVLMGLVLSAFSLFDCQFVLADTLLAEDSPPGSESLLLFNDTRTGLFLFVAVYACV